MYVCMYVCMYYECMYVCTYVHKLYSYGPYLVALRSLPPLGWGVSVNLEALMGVKVGCFAGYM